MTFHLSIHQSCEAGFLKAETKSNDTKTKTKKTKTHLGLVFWNLKSDFGNSQVSESSLWVSSCLMGLKKKNGLNKFSNC